MQLCFLYSLQFQLQFICPAFIENTWVCYAFELYAKALTIIHIDDARVHSNVDFRHFISLGKKLGKTLVRCIPDLTDQRIQNGPWSLSIYAFAKSAKEHRYVEFCAMAKYLKNDRLLIPGFMFYISF
jgi:hypothetical protein